MDAERTTADQPPDLSSEQIQISNVLFLDGTLNRLQKIVSELPGDARHFTKEKTP